MAGTGGPALSATVAHSSRQLRRRERSVACFKEVYRLTRPCRQTHRVVPFPSCPPLNISWRLPNNLGQPLTITKRLFPIGESPSNLRSTATFFKAGKEALSLVSLIRFMDISEARKDAKWQQQNRARQFTTHNCRGSIYAFIFRRRASLAVPAAVARYPSAPEACEPGGTPQGL
jgi:hypothetical protein